MEIKDITTQELVKLVRGIVKGEWRLDEFWLTTLERYFK